MVPTMCSSTKNDLPLVESSKSLGVPCHDEVCLSAMEARYTCTQSLDEKASKTARDTLAMGFVTDPSDIFFQTVLTYESTRRYRLKC